jgi:hypothetical protein
MGPERSARANEDQVVLHLGWSRAAARRLGALLAGSWAGAPAIAFSLVLFLVTLIRFPYFSPNATVDEQLAYYQVARNFNEYGFLNSMLLHDLSSSSRPEHHPFIYNHMPPGPEIAVALLMRLFGENFAAIRLVFAGIFVLGILCFLRVAGIVLGAAGLVGSGFAMFFVDPHALMRTIDHPAYSPFPLLAFLPLVALGRYYDRGGHLALGVGLAAVFMASVYLVYQQLLMVLVSWIALSLLGIVRVDRRHLLMFIGVTASGVLLHFAQSLLLLGPSVFVKELQFTLANRMFAVPANDELRAFYQSIAVVHQGFHQLDLGALLATLWRALHVAGSLSVTRTLIPLVALALIISLVRVAKFDRLVGVLRIPRGDSTAMLRYFGALTVWAAATIVVPLLMFPAYSVSYQLSGANFFFLAIVGTAGMAYLAREIVAALRKLGRPGAVAWRDWSQVGLVCLGVIFLAGTLQLAYRVGKAYQRGTVAAVKQSTGTAVAWQVAEVLPWLKGQVVMTNVFPTVVSFFTREAALGGCETAAFPGRGLANLLVNGDMQTWSGAGGGPVGWGVVGDGLTVRQDLRNGHAGRASGVLGISGETAGQFRQRVSLPRQPEQYFVVATFWVKTTSPRRVRLFLKGREMKQRTKFSAFHSGDGRWELLSVEASYPAYIIGPPVFDVGIQVEPGVAMIAAVSSAGFYASSSDDGAHGSEWAAQILRTHRAADSAAGETPPEPRPDGVDPSKCHAVWIRGVSAATIPKPTHYVLFRQLFTGFTLCREPQCLDRLEQYVASRYPKIFTNELCTVFRLDESKRSAETR